MTPLAQRWPALLASHPEVRDQLLAAYSAPGRRYHDARHLGEVLDHLDTLLELPGTVDRDALELAAWFHDAVYDGRPDDEERSAVLAETELARCGLPASLVDEVVRLVLVTQHHLPGPEDHAGRLLSDADLAILAAERERYDEYTSAVREEYSHLDDATFSAGRRAVLHDLLGRPHVFHTAIARRAWEGRARANLTRELEKLTAPPPPGRP